MSILNTLIEYFQFPFVRYALIAGVLIALCSSLLGVTLVLKRLSFIGDGLSHVAFGAMAIATALSVSSDMLIVMPITIVCAILLLRRNGTKNVRGDAALAMLSVGALALGYLVLNVFSKSANLSADVCSTLSQRESQGCCRINPPNNKLSVKTNPICAFYGGLALRKRRKI